MTWLPSYIRWGRVPATMGIAVAMSLLLGHGFAAAQERVDVPPLDGVTGLTQATDLTSESTGAGAVPRSASTLGTGADESGGQFSGPGAQASGAVVDVTIAGQDVVKVSESKTQSDPNGGSGETTVLAVAGHRIIGSDSSSSQGTSASTVGFLTETCSATNGAVCLALLYGKTTSEAGTTNSSDAYTAVAHACVGGNEKETEAHCEGPIGVTVGESRSHSAYDANGSARANESSTGADICLGGENEQGVCEGIGVVLLHASSSAEASPRRQGTSDGRSSIAIIEAGGEEQTSLSQSDTIEVPPGCPEGGSLLCVGLNQGESSATAGGAASGQRVIEIDVLPGAIGGEDLASGILSNAGTGVQAEDAAMGRREPPVVAAAVLRVQPRAEALVEELAATEALPVTGVGTGKWIATALTLFALGGLALRRARRVG
jgi:hypothetical protein